MKSKKIILFMVEGVTDQASLGLILSRIIENDRVRFHVVGGDITTRRFTHVDNVVGRMENEVNRFLNVNKYEPSDIFRIVHLVDTDGAYIDKRRIVEIDIPKIKYRERCVFTGNAEQIMRRNRKKAQILDKLSAIKNICKIEYSVYYFSCNLEHVLHNKQNLQDSLKTKYAERFVERYDGKEREFIGFVGSKELRVDGGYLNSWRYIQKGENSLQRHTNMHLFFEKK